MPCHLECWKKRKRANKMEIGKKKLLVQNLLLRILGGNLPTIPGSQIWNVLESTKNCEGCIFLAKVEMDNKTSAGWLSRFQVQQRQIGGETLPTEKDVYNKLRIRKGIRQVFKQHPTSMIEEHWERSFKSDKKQERDLTGVEATSHHLRSLDEEHWERCLQERDLTSVQKTASEIIGPCPADRSKQTPGRQKICAIYS